MACSFGESPVGAFDLKTYVHGIANIRCGGAT